MERLWDCPLIAVCGPRGVNSAAGPGRGCFWSPPHGPCGVEGALRASSARCTRTEGAASTRTAPPEAARDMARAHRRRLAQCAGGTWVRQRPTRQETPFGHKGMSKHGPWEDKDKCAAVPRWHTKSPCHAGAAGPCAPPCAVNTPVEAHPGDGKRHIAKRKIKKVRQNFEKIQTNPKKFQPPP